MEKREELLQLLDEARQEMQSVLENIDVEVEIYPSWTIKHVLAHIAGWDDAVTVSLHAHVKGEIPGTPAARGIDFYNAQSVATREALSYEHIVKEWQLARQQLKAAIQEMPQEKLDELLLFPWGQRGTVAQVVHIFVDHEKEHAAEIVKLCKE